MSGKYKNAQLRIDQVTPNGTRRCYSQMTVKQARCRALLNGVGSVVLSIPAPGGGRFEFVVAFPEFDGGN